MSRERAFVVSGNQIEYERWMLKWDHPADLFPRATAPAQWRDLTPNTICFVLVGRYTESPVWPEVASLIRIGAEQRLGKL